ncbi:CNN1 protein, partial [Corvus moneduloides]|nr:CNN1 protein [Corvus moneduloides]
LAQKYDPQRERELRAWIEGTTGRRIGDNFMDGLKDGVILCELINKLQPGSVPKVNEPVQNWHKLENIGNFLRAITRYGVKPHDIFEANDLFENTNHTQVQSTLIALASQVTPLGGGMGSWGGHGVGTKSWEAPEGLGGSAGSLWRTPSVVTLPGRRPLQGLGQGPGNLGGSAGGLVAQGGGGGLSGGGNKGTLGTKGLQGGGGEPLCAGQAGMTAPGTKRGGGEPALGMEHCDTMTIGLQMGSNKGASQQGMTVYGLPRQVYDPKYC